MTKIICYLWCLHSSCHHQFQDINTCIPIHNRSKVNQSQACMNNSKIKQLAHGIAKLKQEQTANTLMTLRYPFGLPYAFVTISNNETSEMEANASPRKPKHPLATSISANWWNFDVAAQNTQKLSQLHLANPNPYKINPHF